PHQHAACHHLCTALRQWRARPWNESGLEQGRIREWLRQLGRWPGVGSQYRGGGAPGLPGSPYEVAQVGRARFACWREPMNELLLDYLPLVIFIAVAAIIAVVLLIVPFVIAYKKPDPEKLSAYECGFNAFDDARMKFDVRFYLVAILFIIFDLEVSFLFPWAVAFGDLGLYGYWSM